MLRTNFYQTLGSNPKYVAKFTGISALGSPYDPFETIAWILFGRSPQGELIYVDHSRFEVLPKYYRSETPPFSVRGLLHLTTALATNALPATTNRTGPAGCIAVPESLRAAKYRGDLLTQLESLSFDDLVIHAAIDSDDYCAATQARYYLEATAVDRTQLDGHLIQTSNLVTLPEDSEVVGEISEHPMTKALCLWAANDHWKVPETQAGNESFVDVTVGILVQHFN